MSPTVFTTVGDILVRLFLSQTPINIKIETPQVLPGYPAHIQVGTSFDINVLPQYGSQQVLNSTCIGYHNIR